MTKHNRRRDGFTLVEIMVVLGIISVLVGLSISAIMRIQNVQQIKSSSDIVEKVQLGVDNQYKAIIAQAVKDLNNGQPNTPDAQNILGICGGDTDRALALLTYCRVRQSFPQTFAEAQTPFSLSSGGYTANFLIKGQFASFQGVSSANLTLAQQSAALLYAAVAQTGAGGSTFASDDATTSAQLDFQQPGAVTIHVYKDAWNQPVGFCRFGTNTELQNQIPSSQYPIIYVNTKTAYQDPLDPSGKLQSWLNLPANSTLLNQALVVFGPAADAANATSFNGTNRRPVVFSNGYNLLYESLNNTPATTPGKAAQDDILGYRLTQLGQRGTIQGH